LIAPLAALLLLLTGALAAGLLAGLGLVLTALPALLTPALLTWSAVFLRLLIAALVVLAQLAALIHTFLILLVTIVWHTKNLLDWRSECMAVAAGAAVDACA
jgi:hypothetical protein